MVRLLDSNAPYKIGDRTNSVFQLNNYSLDSNEYGRLVSTLLDLGKTYALLNPTEPTDITTTTTPDFLDALWRAQKTPNNQGKSEAVINNELQRAFRSLDDFLDDIAADKRIDALKFITNLLKGATNVTSVRSPAS